MTIRDIYFPPIGVGESRIAAIDGQRDLDSAETFSGTPTVVEVTTTDLTLSSKQINTVAIVVLDKNVAIGKGIQFLVSGALAGKVYQINVTTTSSTTPSQTRVYRCWLPTESA